MTPSEKKRIHKMRQEGFSLQEIAVACNRSKSTISHYVQGIEVLPRFQRVWKSKIGGSAIKANERRIAAYAQAVELAGGLTPRDQLIIAACLYWAEGNKTDFSISNTDPKLIEAFLNCLLKLGVTRDRLKVSVRIYEDINKNEAKEYWAKITGITPNEISSVNILTGKKKGKLRYGMCRIRLRKGNDYFNLLLATVKLISENFAPVAQWTEQWTPKP